MWGIIGTEHARFASFVKGPRAVWRYAKTLFDKDSPESLGHNPLGGWFVIVMLLLVAVQAISGLYMTDDVFLDGPYRQLADEETLAIMSTIHHVAFDALLYVIGCTSQPLCFTQSTKSKNLYRP
jgi:cytochrome b